MPNDELLTDEYLAEVLAKEAADCSLKFSALGMEAFTTRKKPENIPKPNTRFLRQIIQGTDSHNRALLAKEALESKARLKDLERSKETTHRSKSLSSKDTSRWTRDDIDSVSRGSRSSRSDGRDTVDRAIRRHDRDKERSSRHKEEKDERKASDRSEYKINTQSEHQTLSSLRRHHDRRESRRSRKDRQSKRDVSDEDSASERRGRKPSDRTKSERSRRSRSPRTRTNRSGCRRQRTTRSRSRSRDRHQHRDTTSTPVGSSKRDKTVQKKVMAGDDSGDSDPLEDFIGPAPPPERRGRGATGDASGIDRRFSESYDPTIDKVMDGEKDQFGWEDEIEAFRDRQKLRAHREERMREAGYDATQIHKFTASAMETLDNTTKPFAWGKRGEERAWDRGKDAL